MAQAYGENLRQAMDTLRTHKLRSGLTVFGVVLGVSVIMLVAALLTGFDQKIQENINQFGADTAFITKWDQGRNGGPPPLEEIQRKPLTLEDAVAMQESCPAVKQVTTFLSTDWDHPHTVRLMDWLVRKFVNAVRDRERYLSCIQGLGLPVPEELKTAFEEKLAQEPEARGVLAVRRYQDAA